MTYQSQTLICCYGLCGSQLEIVLGSGNSCVIKPRLTSTRAQRVHGSGIVHVLFSFYGSESNILFNLVNQHYSKVVGNLIYIVYNKECVYARILFTNDQMKWTSTSFGCFSRSTAVIVDFTWEVNCTQLCNNLPSNIKRTILVGYCTVTW